MYIFCSLGDKYYIKQRPSLFLPSLPGTVPFPLGRAHGTAGGRTTASSSHCVSSLLIHTLPPDIFTAPLSVIELYFLVLPARPSRARGAGLQQLRSTFSDPVLDPAPILNWLHHGGGRPNPHPFLAPGRHVSTQSPLASKCSHPGFQNLGPPYPPTTPEP